MSHRTRQWIAISLFVVSLGLLTGCGKTVPAGARGVYFNWRTGTDVNENLKEGWNWVAPWNRVYLYDVRVKDATETLTVLTEDQLTIKTDISVRYRPDPDQVAKLHQEVGPNYYEVLIGPAIRNQVRDVIAGFSSIDAYTKRNEIQKGIFDNLTTALDGKHIVVEAIMLRAMDFPQQVTEAIERKLAMKQEAEKMKFVLEKESLEAERKRVEARGIADFQKIVSEGLNEDLLKWKGIEATLELAQSPNAKVVVIGQGKEGLPIILGGDN
ncbi:MAG: prohibitin family protein [Deltaproteobacteria bacterium]|nr:prohibitin family protein [Deltaproteobacteria bacterium]MCB9488558.1 prohibitin family protein [Deltaproteobacteria bacterium]